MPLLARSDDSQLGKDLMPAPDSNNVETLALAAAPETGRNFSVIQRPQDSENQQKQVDQPEKDQQLMELDQLPELIASPRALLYDSYRDVDMLYAYCDSSSSPASEFVNVVDMDEEEPLEDVLRTLCDEPSVEMEEEENMLPVQAVARQAKADGHVVKIYKRKLTSEDDYEEEDSWRSKEGSRSESRNNGSPVPLKKRPRMYQIAYPMGHAINKVALPILSFTFEEEFLVMDYVVRIEEFQNRRFDFLIKNFECYPELLVSYVNCTRMGRKVPYSKYIEKTLLKLGVEFTKSNTNSIFKEMKSLKSDVQRSVINFTYPTLYVVFFSILEGNTREKTWVNQHKKTLYITDEHHKALDIYLEGQAHVRSMSIKVKIAS